MGLNGCLNGHLIGCAIGGGAGAADTLATLVPRLAAESARDVVWLDLGGLDAEAYGRRALAELAALDAELTPALGLARVPIAAEAAAKCVARDEDRLRVVPVGEERAFLAALPLEVLEPDVRLRTLLRGVGIETCGELAALAREPVEVRFGPEAVACWRLARADDRRRLFGPVARERPHGSLDFIDYVVSDPARLLFTANSLLGPLCDRLRAAGEHARGLTLILGLANGEEWRRTFRAARPTASRDRWLRLLRHALERITVPDAVSALRLEVAAVEPAQIVQGDLFDRGFATASAVEAAVARLAEMRGTHLLTAETDAHPLVERAGRWVSKESRGLATPVARGGASPGAVVETAEGAALTLQLLAEPEPLEVETERERSRAVPRRYRARGDGWRALHTVAGPDRVSGGQWDHPFAREYFRCVTDDGTLIWLYRDARRHRWYLHGWWD